CILSSFAATMNAERSSSSSEKRSTSPLNNWRSTVSWSGAEPKRVTWKGRSLGSAAKNRSSNWPAGVDQSISPAHQSSVEGMFAWANAQEIERLLDKPVAHFGVPAEAARQSLVSWAHPPRLLADQKPGSHSRLAPRPVRSFFN